jgi:hypothetical protein
VYQESRGRRVETLEAISPRVKTLPDGHLHDHDRRQNMEVADWQCLVRTTKTKEIFAMSRTYLPLPVMLV